jgi:genome maintenance exonuclease 1
MAIVKHVHCFTYPELRREDRPTGRVYISPEGATLPSVTRILAATKDAAALDEWKKRVGEEEAERIKTEAAHVGTAMHRVMEHVVTGEPLLSAADWLEMRGYEMGFRLANAYLHNIDECWGAEVPLYYPGRYAGTCDLVGVWRDRPAIIDFKQSLKPKKKQWITDYFHQLAAYACAHDRIHGTHIDFGVVLVATQTGDTQVFTTTGPEFEDYKGQWLERVEEYYTANPPEA